MALCPYCDSKKNKLIKQWAYSVFEVHQSICENCEGVFNIYYSNQSFSHTIPKRGSPIRKRKEYVKKSFICIENEKKNLFANMKVPVDYLQTL